MFTYVNWGQQVHFWYLNTAAMATGQALDPYPCNLERKMLSTIQGKRQQSKIAAKFSGLHEENTQLTSSLCRPVLPF